jgi:hypothetical protein
MTKTKRIVGSLLLAPMLVLLLTACDREGGSLAGVPVEHLRFCEDVIKAEDVASDPENPSGPAISIGLHDTALKIAPEEIRGEFARLVPLVRQALESEDPDATFRDPNFRKIEDAVDKWVIDNCGIRRRTITAVDYRFDNVPHPIWEGRVGIHLENDGKEVHELALFKINDGVTESAAELVALPPEQAFTKIKFADSAADGPGESDDEVFDLQAGRYLYACFVPVGTTETQEGTGPPHTQRGMFGELNVRPSI